MAPARNVSPGERANKWPNQANWPLARSLAANQSKASPKRPSVCGLAGEFASQRSPAQRFWPAQSEQHLAHTNRLECKWSSGFDDHFHPFSPFFCSKRKKSQGALLCAAAAAPYLQLNTNVRASADCAPQIRAVGWLAGWPATTLASRRPSGGESGRAPRLAANWLTSSRWPTCSPVSVAELGALADRPAGWQKYNSRPSIIASCRRPTWRRPEQGARALQHSIWSSLSTSSVVYLAARVAVALMCWRRLSARLPACLPACPSEARISRAPEPRTGNCHLTPPTTTNNLSQCQVSSGGRWTRGREIGQPRRRGPACPVSTCARARCCNPAGWPLARDFFARRSSRTKPQRPMEHRSRQQSFSLRARWRHTSSIARRVCNGRANGAPPAS